MCTRSAGCASWRDQFNSHWTQVHERVHVNVHMREHVHVNVNVHMHAQEATPAEVASSIDTAVEAACSATLANQATG